MNKEQYGLYEAIITATNSEVILFFIIVATVMAVVVAPLYIAILRDRKEARKHERERDATMQMNERENRQQLISVVDKNSEAITRLTITLDKNGAAQAESLKHIHERLDGQDAILRGKAGEISQINTKIDNVLQNQVEAASKINKIFIKVYGGTIPLEHQTRGDESA